MEASVAVQPVADAGPENNVTFAVMDAQSSSEVGLVLSDYYKATQVRVWEDATTDEPSTTVELPSQLTTGSWSELSLRIDEGELRATVDGTEKRLDIPATLFGSEVYAAIAANAWGNGHPIELAVDNLELVWQ